MPGLLVQPGPLGHKKTKTVLPNRLRSIRLISMYLYIRLNFRLCNINFISFYIKQDLAFI